MGREILFLAHRIPFPPDRGDKIRSHHVLKALAKIAPVHVGTFGETAQDMAGERDLRALATSHCLRRRCKPLPLAGVEAVLSGKPVSLTAFHDAALARWVARTLATRPIAAIFVFSGQMGQYVPADFAGRLVVDLCDVDSAKFEAYAQAGERRWINAREGRLLAAEEARLAARADATLLISEAEAALFHRRLGASAAEARLVTVGNGIDATFFDPAAAAPHPALAEEPGPQLVFTGQMDYRPNVEAMAWAADALMPALRARLPGAMLHIVGRAPVEALRRRDGLNGVRVWGEVSDVRPFLAAADIVVAPLRIARGVQNKVLEAMAMARPVVLTPEAATGIDAVHGRDLIVAPGEVEATVEAIAGVLARDDRGAGIGAAGRQFVIARQSWPAVLANLPGLILPDGARDAA